MKVIFNITKVFETPAEYEKIWPTYDAPRAEGEFKIFNNDGELQYMHMAVSGGWGNGYLPVGKYTLTEIIDSLDPEYTRDDIGWYVHLTPQFDTSRDGLLIHPVARRPWPPSTLGCIGIAFEDAVANTILRNIFKQTLRSINISLEVVKNV